MKSRRKGDTDQIVEEKTQIKSIENMCETIEEEFLLVNPRKPLCSCFEQEGT